MNETIRLSRRDVLKIGGGALAILAGIDTLAAHTGGTSVTKNFWELVETGCILANPQPLRKSLEDKYQINLTPADNLQEIADKYNIDIKKLKESIPAKIDWDSPRLIGLDATLSQLPPRFYSPSIFDMPEHRLRFSLYGDKFSSIRAIACYSILENEVAFSKSGLGQNFNERLRSNQVIVHELTHYVTGGISNFDTAGTYHYKEGFREAAKNLQVLTGLSDITSLRYTFRSVITETRDSDLKNMELESWTTQLGYGASNFMEFWAVAAEYYFLGRESFTNTYSPFIGQELAVKFYQGLKDDLFEGSEYSNGHKLD